MTSKRSLATLTALAAFTFAFAAPAGAKPPSGFLVDGPFSLMEEEGIAWDFQSRPRP